MVEPSIEIKVDQKLAQLENMLEARLSRVLLASQSESEETRRLSQKLDVLEGKVSTCVNVEQLHKTTAEITALKERLGDQGTRVEDTTSTNAAQVFEFNSELSSLRAQASEQSDTINACTEIMQQMPQHIRSLVALTSKVEDQGELIAEIEDIATYGAFYSAPPPHVRGLSLSLVWLCVCYFIVVVR